jgi:protein ImuB
MTRIACLTAPTTPPEKAELPSSTELLQVALAHSPRVEAADAGHIYLDATGLTGLFGDEPCLAARLSEAATSAGLSVRVGIADSRIGALAAARSGPGVVIITPGGDAVFLAAAPLSLLELSEEMAARLSRWGLRTLGELTALPTVGVFERLGAEGVRLQRLARGDDPRPLVSWRPGPRFEESVECDWGLEMLEPVVERMRELAAGLCARLASHGLAADGFAWTCRLGDGRAHEGALTPAVPMTDGAAVGGLLRLALEARPPRGVVEGLTLRARPVRLAPAQESLTDRSRPSPRLLEATLNRLVALVGADGIGAPALLDSHRPDAVALGEYLPHSGPLPRRERGRTPRGPQARHPQTRHPIIDSLVLALRRLRPPTPAAVTLASGRPVALRSARLTGRIVAGVGPWRSSGQWWGGQPWLQDEWDVELADGTLCRIAHDGSAWHLAGIYD